MESIVARRDAWRSGEEKLRQWHGQVVEAAVEPELAIVDAHHHLWDYRQLMGHNLLGILKQQYYMTDELVDDIVGAGHRVTHTVYVEAHAFHGVDDGELCAPVGEVRFAQGIAAQFASDAYGKGVRACAAIVGTADLAKHGAAVEPALLAMKAQCPNFRGIRCSATHDSKMVNNNYASPGLYKKASFREGFALLQKHGLSFDAWMYSSQLSELRDLARAFPKTTIVLDHCGTPACGLGNVAGAVEYDGKQRQILDGWRGQMTMIAEECPNVFVKLGGGVIPQVGAGFESRDVPPDSKELAETLRDMYMWTIATFGADRCMFESNFPVDKVAVSYGVLWNAYKLMTKDLPAHEREMLFSGTAKKVYRI